MRQREVKRLQREADELLTDNDMLREAMKDDSFTQKVPDESCDRLARRHGQTRLPCARGAEVSASSTRA